MKTLFLFSTLLLMQFTIVNGQSIDELMMQNVAFEKLSVRSINKSEYAREVTVRNFSSKTEFTNLIFLNELFTDDGEGNDLRAGDGIYTSLKNYNHNKDVRFKGLNNSIIVSDNWYFAKDFKHKDKLDITKNRDGGGGGGIEIEADVCFCSCGSCYCPACKWFDSLGCWYFCDGKISIKIEINW